MNTWDCSNAASLICFGPWYSRAVSGRITKVSSIQASAIVYKLKRVKGPLVYMVYFNGIYNFGFISSIQVKRMSQQEKSSSFQSTPDGVENDNILPEFLNFLERLPVMAHAIDRNGKLIGVSEVWQKKLGYTQDEVLGRKSTEFLTEDSREYAVREKLPELFRKGFTENVQYRFRTKDNDVIDGLLSANSIRDSHGEILCSVATIIDITDRDLGHHELISSNLKYKALFEDTPVPVWEEDFTEVFTYFEELKKQGVDSFEQYFNDNPEEVMYCAEKVKILNVNNAVVKLHEAWDKKELLGNLDKIFTSDSQEGFKRELIALANGETEVEVEGEVKTISGELRYVYVKLLTFKKPSGDVHAILTTIDITKRKEAEDLLARSERRFRELIEDVNEISIQGYNENREVTFWNRASEQLYGYAHDEALGRKLEDLIIPDYMREEVKNLVNRWINFGEKVPAGPLVLRDKFNADVPVYSSHVLIESAQGKEMFCIDIDLAPIRQVEAELKASEHLLEQINHCFLHFTPDPLENINLLVELAGNHCNAGCALYNRLEDDLLKLIGGWNIPDDYVSEDLAEGHFCYETIVNGSADPVVITDLQTSDYLHSDANVSLYDLHAYFGQAVRFAGNYRGSLCVVFHDDFSPSENDKKLLGIVASAIGIEEERLRAQTEMAKAQHFAAEREKQALVGKIAGKMAHDFNNVLGAIMGNAELALHECEDTYISQTLELILDQTLRGRNLTRNLVAFAKDQEPKQEYFSINDKIELVLNLLRKDMQNVGVVKEWNPGHPEILADPGMIEHCLVNLLQNSLHAMSKTAQPLVKIHTSHHNRQIRIVIEDNGCGIPPEHMDSIFEPAFTLKGGRDTRGAYAANIKGTGYGMANVKKYIEQHNGFINVESKLENGTKVTLGFPEIKKALSSMEIREFTDQGMISGKNILLVEDEHAISEVQYRILTNPPCNHRVDRAENGQTALDLIGKNTYDIISLDHILPGSISGLEVYNQLRVSDKQTPVLFISGNLAFLESIKSLRKDDPLVDHVSKPCQNKEYISNINKLLDKKAGLIAG